jgi:hypothetical protein
MKSTFLRKNCVVLLARLVYIALSASASNFFLSLPTCSFALVAVVTFASALKISVFQTVLTFNVSDSCDEIRSIRLRAILLRTCAQFVSPTTPPPCSSRFLAEPHASISCLQMLLVVAALALCVALSMFVADKYLGNTGNVLESNSSDEDNIEFVPPPPLRPLSFASLPFSPVTFRQIRGQDCGNRLWQTICAQPCIPAAKR